MGNAMVYVIRDREGNYIAPGNFINPCQTEQGWHYFKFSGRYVTGFIYYTAKETAEFALNALRELGYDFLLEYVDYNLIPKGNIIKDKVHIKN